MTGSALAFPTPASLGSLDHYIQAVNRFPLLTAEQETELAELAAAADKVDGPFVALNADDFYGRVAYQRAADFLGGDVGLARQVVRAQLRDRG